MSETPQAKTAAQVPPQTRGQEARTAKHATSRSEAPAPQATGWVGWIIFASVMMIMVGTFQVIIGLTSLFKSGYYVVPSQDLLVNVNFTAWGWTHIILGALAVAAAFGLLAGQMWARIVGIAMAVVSAVVNMAFIAAYPLWSIMVITLDVLVVYAIAMHGKEAKTF
ncbi:MAG TPA: hypothetical protein VK204_13310 [Nocardioidaceae bacterium]|nr:hypothetical protein [Nocardioidaceae bacterium]